MLKNYLKTAIRNLSKNKLFTSINITGLSVGIAAVFLIILFIRDEFSYDRFHQDAQNIYRISWFSANPQTRTPHPMAQAMVRDFPEVISAVSLTPIWGPGLSSQTFQVTNEDLNLSFEETDVLAVDSTFFDVFSFKILKGDEKALHKPNFLLISERAAKKYFNDHDPIGKFLKITDRSQDHLIEVAAVFEDVPDNSHFHFDFLISYVTRKGADPGPFYQWGDFGHFNYLKVRQDADVNKLQAKLIDWAAGYMSWLTPEMIESVKARGDHFKLQRLTDIHLKSNIRWELEPNGNIGYVYIMMISAVFILIIASVNFMNLRSAQSFQRTREIGIRKTLGAHKMNIVGQFMGESLLIGFMALILAGLLVEVTIPYFNEVTGKSISINLVQNLSMILLIAGITIITALLSGIYPAFVLGGIKENAILKKEYSRGKKGNMIKKGLIVFQFTISMFLITGSIIIYSQINYINHKNLGFNRDQVLIVPIKNSTIRDNYPFIKNQLTNLESVISVSAVSNVPGRQFNQNPIWLKSDNQVRANASEFWVDFDVIETLGIELSDGRNFNPEFSTDSTQAFLINQTAAQSLNLEDPVGKALVLDRDNALINGTVIGVVADFNYQSLHQPVRPIIFKIEPSAFNNILIRANTSDYELLISQIENIINQVDPGYLFEYTFLDEDLKDRYVAEQKMGKVFGGFSLLAVIIASMGLFGLAALSFSQKLKEISIRKVMGAPALRILVLLLGGFTGLILVSVLIAAPLSWLVMENWLQNFNYRISISIWDFVLSATGILFFSWMTLGYLTYRALRVNPVDNLRIE